MTTLLDGGIERKTLWNRVWCVIRRPSAEWPVIAEETGGIRSTYFRYVLPLAAIGPVCGYLGGMLFGVKAGALVFPPDPISAAFGAAAGLILNLAVVYGAAVAIDVLAPTFGGKSNRSRAFRLAAYSATPLWLGGLCALYPPAWGLGVVGLYGLYLLYRGMPVMMQTRSPRPWLYALLIGSITTVLLVLVSLVATSITRINLVPAPGAASRWEHRLFPGMDADRRRIERLLREDAVSKAQFSAAGRARAPVTGDELQTLLPEGLQGGFTRTKVEGTDQAGGLGMAASATATYVTPKSRITLQVLDMGSAGGVAARLKPQADQRTANAYSKVGLVEGRLTSESYDRDSFSGSYGVVIGGRFAVRADGEQVVIGDLRNAVQSVDSERLEAMAKG